MAEYRFIADAPNFSEHSELTVAVCEASSFGRLINSDKHMAFYYEDAIGTLDITEPTPIEKKALQAAIAIKPLDYMVSGDIDTPLDFTQENDLLGSICQKYLNRSNSVFFDASFARHGSFVLDKHRNISPYAYLPNGVFTSIAGNLAIVSNLTLAAMEAVKTPQAREELYQISFTAREMYKTVVKHVHPALLAVHGLSLASMQEKIDAQVQQNKKKS